MTAHEFVIVDVFTSRPLTGNPLAVFPDADDLDEGQMQAIAREFAFSETTFVIRPREANATRRLRCFSPEAEVFGAGHNALGAWWVVLANGTVPIPANAVVWQELGTRVLPVAVTRDADGISRLAMTQVRPELTAFDGDRAPLASALGLPASALHAALPPVVSAAGATRHLLVSLSDRGDVARIVVDPGALVAVARRSGCEGCYAFAPIGPGADGSGEDTVAHARGFFPGIGIAEDPATGSAAGPVGAFLAQHGLAPSNRWFGITQGAEMRRPGRIEVRVDDEGVHVGGSCAIVATGRLIA